MFYQNPILDFKMAETCSIILYYVTQCSLQKLYKVKCNHSLIKMKEIYSVHLSSVHF